MGNSCKECATHDKICDACHDNYLCEMYHEYQQYKDMFDKLDEDNDNGES